MSDYTPTTEDIEDWWAHKGPSECVPYYASKLTKRVNEFRAWLADHDAKVRAEERERADQIRISDGMIQRAREAMCAQTGHYPTITAAIEILSAALDGEQADREPSDAEVEAAAEVFWEYDMVDDHRRERARAALIAAQEVRNHEPEARG